MADSVWRMAICHKPSAISHLPSAPGGYMASDSILIIGGGPAGLEAARLVGDLGSKAVVVEKRDHLGGTPIAENYAALTHGFRDAEEAMDDMMRGVTHHPNVAARLGWTWGA